MKIIIGIILVTILIFLGAGLYFLYKDPAQERRTVWSLTLRMGLAVLLIILLVISAWMGWIHPHQVGR